MTELEKAAQQMLEALALMVAVEWQPAFTSKEYDSDDPADNEMRESVLTAIAAGRRALEQQPATKEGELRAMKNELWETQPAEELQRLRALVRAQQITIDKLEQQPADEPVGEITAEDMGRPFNAIRMRERRLAQLKTIKNMNIIIYTKSNCPNCVSAKQLLKSKGLKYTETDVEKYPGTVHMLATQYPDARQMPQIFIDGQRVGGLAGLQAALKQLGV